MVTEFEEFLNLLKSHAEAIGDDVIEPLDEHEQFSFEPEEIAGFVCGHGGYVYYITGVPDTDFFRVRFPISIVGSIAGRMPEEMVTQLSGSDVVNETIRQEAAKEWMHQASEDTLKEISFHIRDRLSGGNVAFRVETTEKGAPLFFEVSRKLFPMYDSYDISQFYDSAQTVFSVGYRVWNYVFTVFEIDENLAGRPDPTQV